MPEFSIIVPIYNSGKYIKKCINSILTQTYTDFELILVDDGSTDESLSLCSEFAKSDERIKLFVHGKNIGHAHARKTGIVNAKGKYTVCVDGDDYITENYLELSKKIIDEFSPELIAFGYNTGTEDEYKTVNVCVDEGFYDGEKIEKTIYPLFIESVSGAYFPSQLWAKVFKTEIYKEEQLAIGENILLGEDGAVAKPCVYRAKSIYVSRATPYFYRYNTQSITKCKKAYPFQSPIEMAKHIESRVDMDKFDFRAQIYRLLVHNAFNVASSQFNRAESEKEIKKSINDFLNEPSVFEAIKKCRYKVFSKGYFARLALKYRWYCLMKRYNGAK